MTTLVLIDVQKDFHPGGSLAIPTADEDANRIANLITQYPTKFTRIIATMDSHQKLHIAHPGFWISGQDFKTHPLPFTIITSQDIIDGKWKPRSDLKIPLHQVVDGNIFHGLDQVLSSTTTTTTTTTTTDETIDLYKYAIEYTQRLEAKGKFKLCIWPEHCLIGSSGHSMVDTVFDAIQNWSYITGGIVEWVMKGENLLTESYSAIEAEVPVNDATMFNHKLHKSLQQSDQLILCGQAMSHCVNYTTRSIIQHWPKDKLNQIILLTDCASSVPGFEETGQSFMEEMKNLGVKLMTSTELFV